MAMIERWRTETHTFHLPFGEVTLTLQDIQIFFGLRVERNVVTYRDQMHHSLDWAMLLQDLTGFNTAPKGFSGTIHLYIRALVKYIQQQAVQDPITDDTLNDRVHRISRLYMLLILGAILFPNTSENRLSLQFLYFLVDLDETGTYSWDSAVLAYLYHCLCQISIDGKKLGGFVPLLQVWTCERVLPFRPIPKCIVRIEPLMPYGRKWMRRG
ncbi:serine/threonine-protein phosphatase 7 long form homolog [Capsicum annuum]|uniref:serine/threonine-protein phosphatase 7 long form homolog n=1 Tax=Capsicum annuum TaxID=4072 RepID=UPI001FB164CF|nr:serine/threonine-protein phosphatase 7 long form homolog [Capsicum annuum]